MDATTLLLAALGLSGTAVGWLAGHARGLVAGHARGLVEGRSVGRADGVEAGRAEALARLTVRTERVTRKSAVFPWRRATEAVRHELWIDGVPTSLSSERVVTDEVEVDERALKALLELGVGAVGGTPALALAGKVADVALEAAGARTGAGRVRPPTTAC